MNRAKIDLDSLIILSKEQVSCDLEGEAAILNIKAGMYYGLDEVGARAWSLIQKKRSVGEIKEAIMSEYEVDPERCERDLFALFNELADKGLIEIKSETAS